MNCPFDLLLISFCHGGSVLYYYSSKGECKQEDFEPDDYETQFYIQIPYKQLYHIFHCFHWFLNHNYLRSMVISDIQMQ